MLFQDFIGSIIGSSLATIGSILTWVIIEFIKKSRPKRRLKRNIKKLYEEFAKKDKDPYKTIKMKPLIEEIGKKNILTILKLKLIIGEGSHILTSDKLSLQLTYYPGQCSLQIRYGDLSYFYSKPEKNQECLDKFLEFYEEQCKLEDIKLKKPKQLKNE